MTEATAPLVTIERHDDGVAIVRLDHPKVNAISAELLRQLKGAVDALNADLPGAVVVTGGDRIFAAGADITEFAGPDEAGATGALFVDAFNALAALPRPTIASISGFALGGGCELALACDFIYASATASFGQPEVNLGLVPGFGGSVRLQQRVGISMARELIFTGRRIKSAEALRIGLVNRVLEDNAALLTAAEETVNEIASKAPTAVANVKDALNEIAGLNVVDGLEAEARSFVKAFETQDSVIGRAAFVAKSVPDFPGN